MTNANPMMTEIMSTGGDEPENVWAVATDELPEGLPDGFYEILWTRSNDVSFVSDAPWISEHAHCLVISDEEKKGLVSGSKWVCLRGYPDIVNAVPGMDSVDRNIGMSCLSWDDMTVDSKSNDVMSFECVPTSELVGKGDGWVLSFYRL